MTKLETELKELHKAMSQKEEEYQKSIIIILEDDNLNR